MWVTGINSISPMIITSFLQMGKRRQNNSAKVIQLVGGRALAPGHGTLLPPRWLGLAFKGLKPIQIQQGGLT